MKRSQAPSQLMNRSMAMTTSSQQSNTSNGSNNNQYRRPINGAFISPTTSSLSQRATPTVVTPSTTQSPVVTLPVKVTTTTIKHDDLPKQTIAPPVPPLLPPSPAPPKIETIETKRPRITTQPILQVDEKLITPPPIHDENRIPTTTTTTTTTTNKITIILTRLSTAEKEVLKSTRRSESDMDRFLHFGPDFNMLDGKRRVLASILTSPPLTNTNRILFITPHHDIIDVIKTLCHELHLPDSITQACQTINPSNTSTITTAMQQQDAIIIFLGGVKLLLEQQLLLHAATPSPRMFVLVASDTCESNLVWDASVLESQRLRNKWTDAQVHTVFMEEIWPTLQDDGWSSTGAGSGLANYVYLKPGIKRKSDRIRNHNAFFSERDVCEWWSRRHDGVNEELKGLGFGDKIQDIPAIEWLNHGGEIVKMWERIEACFCTGAYSS